MEAFFLKQQKWQASQSTQVYSCLESFYWEEYVWFFFFQEIMTLKVRPSKGKIVYKILYKLDTVYRFFTSLVHLIVHIVYTNYINHWEMSFLSNRSNTPSGLTFSFSNSKSYYPVKENKLMRFTRWADVILEPQPYGEG